MSRLRSPERALALAPIAVVTARQRSGIGSSLVRAAIEHARDLGYAKIFVVGDPSYYHRFGFTALFVPLRRPHFMALNLIEGTMLSAVVYAPAFYALS
jgi:putative acetyltransferase